VSELCGDVGEATLGCGGWNVSAPMTGIFPYSGIPGEGRTLLSDAATTGGEVLVIEGGETPGDPGCWPALLGEECFESILSSIDFGTRTRRRL
jgi:hypothetical protein